MRMEITRGIIGGAQKVVAYGPEGIGKSTFASQFPDPLFIDTEGSTKELDVARLPKPTSWTMLMEQVRFVRQNPTVCKTLVIDTADWAEQLCITEICAKNQKNGIEDFGWGHGYTYLVEEFGKLLNLLSEVVDVGINAVLTAHAQMRKFEQPDEAGAYDRWELKMGKKTSPLIKEWADMVLFANYKTMVVNVDGQGAQKGKNKARGGKRIMYTTHHPCWDAKNRHGLPEELDFDYAQIAHCIEGRTAATPTPGATAHPAEKQKPVTASEAPPNVPQEETAPAKSMEKERKPLPFPWLDPLFDLMIANQVTPEEIQAVVSQKGYYPAGTPLENYEEAFVKGVLIGAWDKVYQEVVAMAAQDTF